MAETVIMDGTTLSCAGVAAVARGDAQVAVAPSGLARAAAAHRAALEAAARSPFYGRTTGVGANGMMAVVPGNGHGLRLVRSHVGGAGELVDGDVARGMLAVRLAPQPIGVPPLQPRQAEQQVDDAAADGNDHAAIDDHATIDRPAPISLILHRPDHAVACSTSTGRAAARSYRKPSTCVCTSQRLR